MPSAEQLRSRLLKKLSELFQLDQPDLDFGFYRIMHAKAQEVQDFIGTDLLKIVADAFGDADEARKAELQAAYEKAIQTAKDFGAPNPEETEPVKKAKAALDAVKDTASAEADVYDHLYRFFERYYDDGDFISRRYYTRETSGKAAPFAVPYNGEEVKLHWANADQYYIKSAEYFSNFTFDLRQAQEIRALRQQNQIGILLGAEDDSPIKVHFRVVEATEGEHGNVKASEANKRFFILHAENPVAPTETGELVVNFEYRPDPEKTGQENTWRDKRNAEAVETILKELESGILKLEGGEAALGIQTPNSKILDSLKVYLRLFKIPAPTNSDKKRPVLAKYVNQYTARNTMDYFIHKDLGGFLRRELDFYIKNEVMRLDDIENAEAPAVESYLAKIKVLRKIAGKLIDFLAQLEDFQKKLWLKKKFIIETNYCITLDRVPEELYPEIAENEAQIDEWVKLFAIDEIGASHEDTKAQSGDLFDKGIVPFSRPLTVEFLKANNKLVLDTRFFDDSFKARLVASIENFDELCDGLLIHSENFQALNLLQERYREQVKCVYIDPPYNTGGDGFAYKDSYQHSSWLSMMSDRLHVGNVLRSKSGFQSISIDEKEQKRLSMLCEDIYGSESILNLVTVKMSEASGVKMSHADKRLIKLKEYVYFIKNGNPKINVIRIPGESWNEEYKTYIDGLSRENRETLREILEKECCDSSDVSAANEILASVQVRTVAEVIKEQGIKNDSIDDWRFENAWRIAQAVGSSSVKKYADLLNNNPKQEIAALLSPTGILYLYNTKYSRDSKSPRIQYLFADDNLSIVLGDIWSDIKTTGGVGQEGQVVFPNGKKPEKLLSRILEITSNPKDIILDYFVGSGTSAAVAHKMKRKWVGVEQGDYFDDYAIIRLKNVLNGEQSGVSKDNEWNGGGLFKYIRLESYEDTLNNLRLDHNTQRKKAVAANPALKEDYMLRYLLDVETRGSQSLLNIDAFADPTAYTLEVKKPGTDEYATRAVDLIETFNYLIGLRVMHTSVPQTFQATFKRITDPELPEDQHTKLVVDGRIRQDEGGPWWFRKVEGWVPKDAANPNNSQREKVLVVWRKLTDDIEQDNLMLDEWFQKNRISTRDFEFDTIYVNGSNNLPNLKLDDENWKVRLIEEEFMKRMWNGENA